MYVQFFVKFWQYPKINPGSAPIDILSLVVYDAIAHFNDGAIAFSEILKDMTIQPGDLWWRVYKSRRRILRVSEGILYLVCILLCIKVFFIRKPFFCLSLNFLNVMLEIRLRLTFLIMETEKNFKKKKYKIYSIL